MEQKNFGDKEMLQKCIDEANCAARRSELYIVWAKNALELEEKLEPIGHEESVVEITKNKKDNEKHAQKSRWTAMFLTDLFKERYSN